MQITITGISGFVGQNLKEYLCDKRDYEIFALSLRNHDWIQQFNVRSEAIIHLAGKAHDTSNTSDEKEYFIVNRDLTIALFEQFINSDVKDFFYFSSVKSVADTVEGVLIENYVGKPITPYGKSKLAAEEYILNKTLPEGKRLFIIRPCMIHGPGNKGNLNLLYNVVKKGIPWPLAAFHNQRSFLSIDNLSFLVEAMIKNTDLPSGIYNFADDDALSTNELVHLISGTLGHRTKLWAMPASVIKFLARLGDIIPLPLNSERLKKLTESYIVSNCKIKKELGIKSLPTSSKEGLVKTFQSFN